MAISRNQGLLAAVSLVVTAASSGWIYYREFKAPHHNVVLHREVGQIMAEQTAKLLGRRGRILVVTIPTGDWPELQTQMDAFRQALQRLGDFDVKEHSLDPKGQSKYGVGTGLSGRRFVRLVKNHPEADAIVSFVGAPKLTDAELAEIGKRPIFIAESRSPDHLPELFQKKILLAAVVSRFVFPAPGPAQPATPREWFDKRYQLLTADDVKLIPPSEPN